MFDLNPSQSYLRATENKALKPTPLSLEVASFLVATEIMTKSCISSKAFLVKPRSVHLKRSVVYLSLAEFS